MLLLSLFDIINGLILNIWMPLNCFLITDNMWNRVGFMIKINLFELNSRFYL